MPSYPNTAEPSDGKTYQAKLVLNSRFESEVRKAAEDVMAAIPRCREE